ncbi:hypothetical protein BG842_10730 [Haladaptatus sp. W1]|uniref:hypothetical protein n=1 Tax=Haladaptatus sp. W1 TaxID=1897478 RepID=UPI000849A5FE|nr:hypothetical protein [Haladaptatus sp. W1]ODR80771.1 hypothetical protein BG842_10730 [Haladaptatus sp. W1]
MTGKSRIRRLLSQLAAALAYPVSSIPRAVGTAVVAAVTYVLLILSTFPEMSMQMLGAGMQWADDTLVLLTENVLATNGWFGLGLIVCYAVLTGVAVTNAAAQARVTGVSSLSDLTGVLPGLVASGCASCGAGLLGFLGFAGAMAALPFHGDLLRVGGIVLLLGFLGRAGDPRSCRVTV